MNNFKFNYRPNYLLYIFITLKLCKVISWSWWWVLAPAWIPFVLLIIVLIIVKCLGYKKLTDRLGDEFFGTHAGS